MFEGMMGLIDLEDQSIPKPDEDRRMNFFPLPAFGECYSQLLAIDRAIWEKRTRESDTDRGC